MPILSSYVDLKGWGTRLMSIYLSISSTAIGDGHESGLCKRWGLGSGIRIGPGPGTGRIYLRPAGPSSDMAFMFCI